MKVKDLTQDQVRKGLRIRSLTRPEMSGTVHEVIEIDDNFAWILWDWRKEKGEGPYSGFYGTDCDCEVIVDTEGNPVYA